MNRASLAAILTTIALTGTAAADGYPNRPVTFIVPYGAGGPVDTMARTLSEAMRATLGQPIVIENVTGANGTIGVGRAVHAAPDGYTVSIGNWPSHITNGAIYNLSYDIQKDLIPVARLPQNPYIAVVRKDLPAKNLKDFIGWLNERPGNATEGTAGLGSGQHIAGVYFQKITGTRFQFIPYKAGSADIIRDITAGHIDFTFDQRLDAAPDIPTVDEAGAPGVYILTWYGLWLPKGAPQEAVDKLGAAARAAMADPAVRQRLLALGQQIPPPEQQTAAALAAYQKAEIEKWHPLIKEAGIKAE
jgi:tripartite-type tricarboxylate transporter receptor subunit TctC